MDWASTLQGVIISGFMGLVMGNFITSPIYRFPRNEPLFVKDPYCGDCNSLLKPIDLFPVLSWLMTKGKCRYCGAHVPGSYTVAEALVCVLYVLFYLKLGFSEQYLLLSFGVTTMVMLGMMLFIDNFFSGRTLGMGLALAVIYRTLQEGTSYGAASGVFAGIILGTLMWRVSGVPMKRDANAFPHYLKLLSLAGAWLPLKLWIAILPICAVGALARKEIRWLPEYAIIGSTIAMLVMRS